jgi:hypothetical protein
MPAGVPDAGQAVILGTDRQVQRPAPGACHKGGGQLADAAGDGKARLGQGFSQPGRGPFFLKAELRMGVNAVTQRDQLGAHGIQACLCGGFGLHGRAPLPRASVQRCSHDSYDGEVIPMLHLVRQMSSSGVKG